MSGPAVLRWPLPGRVVDETGQPIACPVCGSQERLLLGLDLDDHSDAPSYMGCHGGHSWAEERMPRRLGALLLADILDIEPGLLAHLDDLQREHGAG